MIHNKAFFQSIFGEDFEKKWFSPVKLPLKIPPVDCKNKLNLELIGVPLQYISKKFTFPDTSKV